MKKLLILAAVLALGSYALADSVLFETNFDDLELGPIVANYPNVWSYCYGRPNENNFVEVVEGGVGGSGRSLRYRCADLYVATQAKIPNSENHSLTNDFKVSFKICFSNVGNGVNFNSIDGMGELAFKQDGDNAFKISNTPSINFSSTNSCPLCEWIPVSYVMNGIPGNRELLSVQFGDVMYDYLNIPISSDKEKDCFPNFRFFPWGGGIDVRIDDLKIELIEFVDRKFQPVIIGSQNRIELADNPVILSIPNKGPAATAATVTISSDYDFIKFHGESPATIEIPARSTVDFPVTIDRAASGNDYYLATITATSGDKFATFTPLFIQSGVEGEGYTYYKSHFEKFETGQDIRAVDPAWINGYNVTDDSPIVEMGGEKVLQINYKNYAAFHIKCDVPEGTSENYNYRVSFKGLIPSGYREYSQYYLGSTTDGGVNVSELILQYLKEAGGVTFSHMGNTCPIGEWFDVSYTFNFNLNNSRLLSITFGDVTSNLNLLISNAIGDKDYFDYMRFFGSCRADSAPIYIKDLVIESVNAPPIFSINPVDIPISYATNEFKIVVRNDGGNSFKFFAEVVEGAEYIGVNTETNTVKNFYELLVKIDRKKMSYGFYRPVVRITSDIPGQEPIDVKLAIQSGNNEEGYVIYASNFNSLHTTKEEEGKIVGELSEQDACWVKSDVKIRADIVMDPVGSRRKVVKLINIYGPSSRYYDIGYLLNLRIPAEAAQDYDVVCSMDMYFPKISHSIKFSQGKNNHQCEAYFHSYTDKVALKLYDISTRNEWNQKTSAEGIPVLPETWFPFYMRFNTKLINNDHKSLYALTFGENEYHLEGEDSKLSYPGGILEEELNREDLSELSLYGYADNAKNVCIDNVNILLVPKGLPEPALFGVLALVALAFMRKQR